MPRITGVLGVKGDMCNCGRRATIRHCPCCGSGRIYAYSGIQYYEREIAGETQTLRSEHLYRCLGCGYKFTDEDRKDCVAPPAQRDLAEQRARVMAEELTRTNPEKAIEILQTSGDVGQALAEEFTKTETSKRRLQDTSRVPIEEMRKVIADAVNNDPDIASEEKEAKIQEYLVDNITDEWTYKRLASNLKFPLTKEQYIAKRLAKEPIPA